MATKDLGRTPLEAGNTTEYHEVRRELRQRYRREAKAFCRRAARDPEFADEAPAPVAPEHRRPNGCWPSDMHADAIGPVKRWIHKQVGRRWDDVYSEIRSTFDVRTLAGRHIVEQHLLQYVDIHGNRFYSDLVVDDDGVLRERPQEWWRKRYRSERKTVSDAALSAWLSGRTVTRRTETLYWCTPTGHTHREHREVSRMRADHMGWENVSVPVDVMNYRQGRPLSRKEIAFYERLTSTQRAATAEALVTPRVATANRPTFRFARSPAPGAPPLMIDKAA
ncbi:hypothetical protein HY634_03960 [Candidatus Uhrbacteria bacterium]|nr:hypothetical protein [Candidatus Uhrbacteria bacterium]